VSKRGKQNKYFPRAPLTPPSKRYTILRYESVIVVGRGDRSSREKYDVPDPFLTHDDDK
jgi:hypothetical protein